MIRSTGDLKLSAYGYSPIFPLDNGAHGPFTMHADITESVLDTLAEGNYIKYHIDETGEMVLEQIEKNEDEEV